MINLDEVHRGDWLLLLSISKNVMDDNGIHPVIYDGQIMGRALVIRKDGRILVTPIDLFSHSTAIARRIWVRILQIHEIWNSAYNIYLNRSQKQAGYKFIKDGRSEK